MRIIVTGGAGFIGSAVVRNIIATTTNTVLNIDKLTYAGNLENLVEVENNDRYSFVQADICDTPIITEIFKSFRPNAIMHLAAESHVDRSIDSPDDFIQTNIMGTYALLEVARKYWQELNFDDQSSFLFHHISTDEVYGDLGSTKDLFTEETSYAPSSPYSASKASSDHLVRAWAKTYSLPILITNCSNNYGPFHFPEKLIPLVILNALEGKPIPVYGKGEQIRDWLYVEDHADALYKVLTQGKIGETYNIGGHNEKQNIEVVLAICALLDELAPKKPLAHGKSASITNYKELITYVDDRPGHDTRYAIDATKIQKELSWKPEESFETGLRKTVEWYLNNRTWAEHVQDGSYARERLGVNTQNGVVQ